MWSRDLAQKGSGVGFVGLQHYPTLEIGTIPVYPCRRVFHGDTLSSLVTVVVSMLCIYGVDPPTIRSLNFQGHQSTFRAQIIRSSSIFGDLHLTCGIVLQTWTNHFLFFLLLRLLSQKKSLNFDKAMIACHKLSLKESSSRLEIPPETRMESSFKGR